VLILLKGFLFARNSFDDESRLPIPCDGPKWYPAKSQGWDHVFGSILMFNTIAIGGLPLSRKMQSDYMGELIDANGNIE